MKRKLFLSSAAILFALCSQLLPAADLTQDQVASVALDFAFGEAHPP